VPMQKRCIVWMVLVFIGGGCGAEEESFDAPARVAIPSEAIVASFGELSDTTEVDILTWARLASLSESGRYLTIGDHAPPFLRILDRKTGTKRSFAERGHGPGELMSAYSLDFLGDSVLLVLSAGQRLERFNVAGDWLTGHRLPDTGVLVKSIAVGCGERIFAYGVPVGHRRVDTVPWVHELKFGSEVSAEALLDIPGTGYFMGYGGLNGFDGNSEGLLLWHRAREPQVGYWLPCDGGPAILWSHTAPREIVERSMTLEGGEVGGAVLTLPDTLFQGAAALGQVKVRLRKAFQPEDGVDVSSFHVVGQDECQEVEILGDWTLHDAHRDGLVIATSDPFPRVEVIEWDWFNSVLTRVSCGL